MAKINFPNNRDQLNPPLPTGALQDGDTTNITADGVTITYIYKKPASPNTDSWWKSMGRVNNATPIDKIEEGNTSAEVIDTGTDGQFVVSTEGAARMKVTSDGTVKLNGTNIDTDPSIQLNPDGSAVYEGNVDIGNYNASSATNTGSKLYATGRVFIQRKSSEASTSEAFKLVYGTDTPFKVLTNGTSTFGSSSEISLNADGSGSFASSVGIGTTTPSSLLHVAGNGKTKIILANGTDNSGVELIATDTAGEGLITSRFVDSQLLFGTSQPGGAVEHMRLDNPGRLLVGTSAARSNIKFNATSTSPRVQLETANNNWNNGLSIINNSASGFAPSIRLGLTNGSNIGDNDLIGSDQLGEISFLGADGTHLRQGAKISANVDGTPGSGVMPASLTFMTTAASASQPTERLRIASDGKIILPTGSPGIQFGSTDGGGNITSQTLDDYEEGIWADAANTPNRRYTKVGNLVHCTMEFGISSTANASDTAFDKTLPFAVRQSVAGFSAVELGTFAARVGSAWFEVPTGCVLAMQSTNVRLKRANGSATTSITVGELRTLLGTTATFSLFMSFQYIAA